MCPVAALSSNNGTLRQPLELENAPPSADHTVIFYEEDSELLDALAESIRSTVIAGNSVLVIATPAHHTGLFNRLKGRCPEAYAAIIEARFFLVDAEETIGRFMVDGLPDPDRFNHILRPYIAHLAANARGENPSIFMFGEMAALLWEQGKYDAALHVEKLRNQLLASCSVNNVCAYPVRIFADGTRDPATATRALYSCVVPPQNSSCSFP